MRFMREETFGPVAPVRVVPDFDAALLEAVHDDYGLAATVLTADMVHAQTAWRALPVGTVKATDGGKLLYEGESEEQYVRVIEQDDGDRILELKTDGVLTVGTDKPAYPPYFEDDDPSNGKGFESGVAYAIADELDLDRVEWTVVPFNNSFRPGQKDFDFDINQISVTDERDRAVDFSDSYYEVNQSLVALEGTPITEATSLADLAEYLRAAPGGLTSGRTPTGKRLICGEPRRLAPLTLAGRS